MSGPSRKLPAPLYGVQKRIRDAGKTPEQIAWDQYLIPGLDEQVLRNKVGGKNEPYGCSDPGLLQRREERWTATRMLEQADDPIPGRFDFAHMQAIHHHLFQDVYEWAGEPRTVNMAKLGHDYIDHAHVEKLWGKLAGKIEADNHLQGISDPNEFADKLAFVWGRVNVIHAFREGNTRSQAVFFQQFAKQAGWDLDIARLSPKHPRSLRSEFVAARFHHQENHYDHGPLADVLKQVVTPIETLEQRLERAAAPSIEHERWAPRATVPVASAAPAYDHPDKMRTAHRRDARTNQESPMAIDPSKSAQPIPPRPGSVRSRFLPVAQVPAPGQTAENALPADFWQQPEPDLKPEFWDDGTKGAAVQTQVRTAEDEPERSWNDDGDYPTQDEVEEWDKTAPDMAARDAADRAAKAPRWLEERYRKFPELAPPFPNPEPKPSTARHRAPESDSPSL